MASERRRKFGNEGKGSIRVGEARDTVENIYVRSKTLVFRINPD